MDKHDRTLRSLWTGLLVSMLLAGLFSSCVQPTPDAAEVARELAAIYATQTAQAQAAATSTPTPLPEDAVVIPDTTQVLAEAELANLTSISDDLTVFTFAGSSEQLASLKQNDVIVGDVSDQAPDGFLRRVESITTDGGQVIVHTAPARLEDAIDTGALAITEDLKPTDVRAGWKRPGVELVSLAPPALPTNWHVALADVVLFDLDGNTSTTRDQVRANGALDFTTRLDFDLKIAWFKIEKLRVVASATETADIMISGDVTLLNVQEEVQVAYFPLNPISFAIGPVPVVLTPILTVTVGLDGTAHVGFVARVTQTFSASAGVRYENKRWQPIAQFNNDFDYLLPQVTGNLQVGAYGSVQLAVLIYGVGGPWASLDGNFGLDVNIQRSPPWRLYGGLRCRAGVRAEILGYKLGDFAQTVLDTKIPIAEGNLSTAAPSTATWTPTRPPPILPTPTWTPSPTSTPTWTPSPTSTPTWTPSPTSTPTWTPSPTASPTSACAIATDPTLAPAWELGSLGCPTAASVVVWSAWQPFERGSMFWRNDMDWTYVLNWQNGTNTAQGNWATGGDAWKWDGSFPDGRGLTPPAGRIEPVRGFGSVWFDKLGGPASAVGWATAQEQGFCATIQPFARGVIFRSNPTPYCQDQLFNWATDPSFPPLFVTILADGTWQRR